MGIYSEDYEIVEQKSSYVDYEASFASLMKNVYLWMTGGLIMTGITAMIVANSPSLLDAIFSSRATFFGLLIAELALVWFLSSRIMSMSFVTAGCMFALYAILTGATLSSIFIVYTMDSIAQVFFICAGTFATMSVMGFVVKKDLSGLGRILIFSLLGLIIATFVNIFMQNSGLAMVLNYAGVAIFVGLTAYDTQKIKRMLIEYGEGEMGHKLSVLASLTLYLDFINLFLYLLKILGNRK